MHRALAEPHQCLIEVEYHDYITVDDLDLADIANRLARGERGSPWSIGSNRPCSPHAT